MGEKLEVPQQIDDERWMQLALTQATKAGVLQEVPVGAVLVIDGEVIAQSYNNPIANHDATGHAELNVIRQACAAMQNYRLPKSILYVTLEPCTMCLGAIIHSRIERVVFAATEPRAGALISAASLDFMPFNHSIEFTRNVLQEQSSILLREFFKGRRQQKRSGE